MDLKPNLKKKKKKKKKSEKRERGEGRGGKYLAMYPRTSSARAKKKLMRCSGFPSNFSLKMGSWVAGRRNKCKRMEKEGKRRKKKTNSDGTSIQVTFSHHNTTKSNQRGCSKSKFLGGRNNQLEKEKRKKDVC